MRCATRHHLVRGCLEVEIFLRSRSKRYCLERMYRRVINELASHSVKSPSAIISGLRSLSTGSLVVQPIWPCRIGEYVSKRTHRLDTLSQDLPRRCHTQQSPRHNYLNLNLHRSDLQKRIRVHHGCTEKHEALNHHSTEAESEGNCFGSAEASSTCCRNPE